MHVLVVDDEPDLRMILRINLERWGHQVSLAADAETALETCRTAMPDAMLLDLSMPDKDGTWLLEALGPDGWPAEVAILSAAMASEVEPLIERGARFLAKPFGVAELEALVAEMAGESAS